VVAVYNAQSLIQVATLGDGPPASGCTSFVSFSPDGKILAYGNRYSAGLWDTVTHNDLREPEQDLSLPDSIDQLESVAFSPDSRILAIGDRSKQIVLWNISTRKVLARLKGHDGWVSALAFSPDAKTLYSGGIDRTVKLWDLSSFQSEGQIDAEKIRPFATLKGHTDSILSIKCALNGKVVATVGTDHTVKLWSDTAGREFEKFDNVSGVFPRADLAVTNVGDGDDNKVTALDLGAQMQSLPAKLDQTPTIVSADRKLFAFESGFLSGTESRAMDLVESVSGHKLASIPSRFLGNFASFSQDSRLFCVIGPDNRSVLLWDTVERRHLTPIKNDVELRSFLMSPDGRLLVTFDKESGTVKSWEIVSQRRVAQFVRNRKPTNSEDEAPDESDPQVLSPDGRILAFSDSSKVELWQVNSNDAPLALANSDMRAPVSVIAFSPDGKLLAVGDEIGTVRIWDAVKRQELTTFMGHKDSVTTLAFSPDSRALASGGGARDGAVKLYGMTTMRELLTLTHEPSPTSETHAGQGSEDAILQLFFSSDGRALITQSNNFILRIWRGNVPQT
jgi:WD40 repeat protein